MWILVLLILSGPDKGDAVSYRDAEGAVIQFATIQECAAKMLTVGPRISKEAGDTMFAMACKGGGRAV